MLKNLIEIAALGLIVGGIALMSTPIAMIAAGGCVVAIIEVRS